MQRIIPVFIALMLTVAFAGRATAQSDKLYKHNGDTASVKIIDVGDYTIRYIYEGETAEHVIGGYAVEHIRYADGHTDDITVKINVAGKNDWQKVVVVSNKEYLVGLRKIGEIKAWYYGYTKPAGDKYNKKKDQEILSSVAEKGAAFIYIPEDKDGNPSKMAFIYTY